MSGGLQVESERSGLNSSLCLVFHYPPDFFIMR
jgi:hypothetical protein